MAALSALERARRHSPGRTDSELVERLASRIIRELDERPPVDLAVVAGYRGIDRIETLDMDPSGMLIPGPAGLVMALRSRDGDRRRRFTGFHEVGHTLQPGFADSVQMRCPNIGNNPRDGSDPEALADTAAASLLLPEAFFAPAVEECAFGLDCVSALSDSFDASFSATLYRTVRFWPEPSLALVLEPGVRKADRDDPTVVPALRVRSRYGTGDWPYVPINKSAAAGGPLSRAFEGEIIDEVTDLADLGISFPTPVQLSAKLMSYTTEGRIHRRVIALYRQLSI